MRQKRPNVIQLSHITKIYRLGEEELKGLDDVSLTIREGEFVAVVGPSGSGKSTLMNLIGCLDTPDEGTYCLNGEDVEACTGSELAGIRSHKIGFIFQDFNLIENLTAYENVELPLIYQKVRAAERKKRVQRALERVDIWERRRHKPSQMSGGQRQRVAIARAMVTEPEIYLADEPTGNLDSKTGRQIMEIFHELHRQGHTIVLITHDMDLAAEASRSIRIYDGKIARHTVRKETKRT